MPLFTPTDQGQLYSLGLLAMIGNWQSHNIPCTGQMLTVAPLNILDSWPPVLEMETSVLSVTLTFLVI